MVLNLYRMLLQLLKEGKCAVVMTVIRSTGSSPGRKGFTMIVTEDSMHGTIGGGIMEHKLVELSKTLLSKGRFTPFIRHQVHSSDAVKDRSGMICSGEQTVAFYFVDSSDIAIVEDILNEKDSHILYNSKGISNVKKGTMFSDAYEGGKSEWECLCPKQSEATAYIFGGGHVSLALSELLSRLDFRIHVFDDRHGLNTMEVNRFAETMRVIKYEESSKYVSEGNGMYVVIMSFGYRTDKIILKSLYGMKFSYIGMLGSKEKIRQMKSEFISEGYSQDYFECLHAPIGIDIKSETADEIAVSIAAELIAVRNRAALRQAQGDPSEF